jgi:hypothetical protein
LAIFYVLLFFIISHTCEKKATSSRSTVGTSTERSKYLLPRRDLKIISTRGSMGMAQYLPFRYFQVCWPDHIFILVACFLLLHLCPDLIVGIETEAFQETNPSKGRNILNAFRTLEGRPMFLNKLTKGISSDGDRQARKSGPTGVAGQ